MVHSTYDVILEPAEEGGFTAYVPALRGCVSEGDTEAEALENVKDAILTWLDTWEQIDQGKDALRRKVVVGR
ncbi:MAG: type II toxin-antitoxin system HicB family antitoxin [Dehalococcoidia bacterium]